MKRYYLLGALLLSMQGTLGMDEGCRERGTVEPSLEIIDCISNSDYEALKKIIGDGDTSELLPICDTMMLTYQEQENGRRIIQYLIERASDKAQEKFFTKKVKKIQKTLFVALLCSCSFSNKMRFLLIGDGKKRLKKAWESMPNIVFAGDFLQQKKECSEFVAYCLNKGLTIEGERSVNALQWAVGQVDDELVKALSVHQEKHDLLARELAEQEGGLEQEVVRQTALIHRDNCEEALQRGEIAFAMRHLDDLRASGELPDEVVRLEVLLTAARLKNRQRWEKSQQQLRELRQRELGDQRDDEEERNRRVRERLLRAQARQEGARAGMKVYCDVPSLSAEESNQRAQLNREIQDALAQAANLRRQTQARIDEAEENERTFEAMVATLAGGCLVIYFITHYGAALCHKIKEVLWGSKKDVDKQGTTVKGKANREVDVVYV